MAVTGMHIGGEIARALGLPRETTDIVINVGLDEPISVTCRFYPDEDAMRAMMAVITQFQLVPAADAPKDMFTQDQRIRLFRQGILRGEYGVESPFLKRYLAYKEELAEWQTLVDKVVDFNTRQSFAFDANITVIYQRMAVLETHMRRMEAGERD